MQIDPGKLDKQIDFFAECQADYPVGYSSIMYYVLQTIKQCLSPRKKNKRGIKRKQ